MYRDKTSKGIILAGGTGSRLFPMTRVVNKHLLPVFDKPMIYYPLATLISAGITDVLLIARAEDLKNYQLLFGAGEALGINIQYSSQDTPGGLPEAFLIGQNFIGNDNVCLILGDNIILNEDFEFSNLKKPATIFGKHVIDGSAYGVLNLNQAGE